MAEDLFVDAEDPACSSWCRYINHDANPNLALKVPKHSPKHTPKHAPNTPNPPLLNHTRTPPNPAPHSPPAPYVPHHSLHARNLPVAQVLPKGMDGKPRAWFVTLRAVSAGEELYWDYGPEFWSEEDDGVASGFDAPIRQGINEGATLDDADAFAQWAALQAGGGGEG